MGGHSLLATQVISRVRQTFGVDIKLDTFFSQPNIAALAQHIQAARTTIERIQPIKRDDILPLSFAQQRLWFIDQLEPNSATYNIPIAVHLVGQLKHELLSQSLQKIIERHEVLRTTFAHIDGQPQQLIVADVSFLLPLEDLSHVVADEQPSVVKQILQTEAERPFSLTQAPLLRTKLLRLNPEEHILLLNMHHIISDGWSMGILVKEIAALYQAFAKGQPSPLSDLPIQYADFAAWQRQWLQGDTLERQLGYWQDHLSGIPTLLNLPTDYSRPPCKRIMDTKFLWCCLNHCLPLPNN